MKKGRVGFNAAGSVPMGFADVDWERRLPGGGWEEGKIGRIKNTKRD